MPGWRYNVRCEPYIGRYEEKDGVIVLIERCLSNYRVTFIDKGQSSAITMTREEVIAYISKGRVRKIT